MAIVSRAREDAAFLVPSAERFALGRRDYLLIALFWVLYAFLIVANRLFDGSWGGPTPRPVWGPVAVAFMESFCWGLLTPGIFWMAGRFGVDRSPWRVQLLVFSGIGILIALGLTLIGDGLRSGWMAPPPRPAGPEVPPPHDGPPWWFGFLNALVIYGGLLAVGLARAYSLRYRYRKEQAAQLQAQLSEAHLEALRRQLDPHFLFNTLNAISSLVERDPRGVRRIIARLSELMRYSLESAHEPEITLRQELDLLDRYLDILQVRFQNRLNVEKKVAEKALDALVPNLILQPLVENAIKHGVEKLTGTGNIQVEAEVTGETLVLEVRNNGPDPSGPSPAVGIVAGGVGLRNTIGRLEQLYGSEQRFELQAAEGGGALARITLPLRYGSPTMKVGTVPERGDAAHAG